MTSVEFTVLCMVIIAIPMIHDRKDQVAFRLYLLAEAFLGLSLWFEFQ